MSRPGNITRTIVRTEWLLVLAFGFALSAAAWEARHSGQVSAWGTGNLSGREQLEIGMRYIPEFSLETWLSETIDLGFEAALDLHGFGTLRSGGDIDPYRLSLRVAGAQYETRAGLQKINFGSATLLRPLMWFDTIDPRDPLQITDGVYGLLGRYYFLNNANLWAWVLYENDHVKGWEVLPSDDQEVEFGGRVQLPVPVGEIGLSYHHRRGDPNGEFLSKLFPRQGKFKEQRIGLDGKWDVGVGLWFEGTLTHQDLDAPLPHWQRMLTVGMDYTFDIGNGPHLLFEQFMGAASNKMFSGGHEQFISALEADYPLGLLDTLAAIVYYDWDSKNWSRFLAWRRTYDQWQVHVSLFWNSEQDALYEGDTSSTTGLGGKGAQVMVVFNY